MLLRSVNLNQLPLLQALLNSASVAEAATISGLSQPAMSGALAQLRETFQDPLLVRTGRTMKLTERATELRAQVNTLCEDISAFYKPDVFDPTQEVRTFVIAAPDDLTAALSSTLMQELKTNTPGIRLRFVNVPMNLPEQLVDRKIDLAVCGNFQLWPSLTYHHLFDDDFVYAVRPDHPLLRIDAPTDVQIRGYPSVTFSGKGLSVGRGETNSGTDLPILQKPARITTEAFSSAALIAASTHAVARIPHLFLTHISHVLPLCPLGTKAENNSFATGMFWSDIQNDSRANLWLRSEVIKAMTIFREGHARKADFTGLLNLSDVSAYGSK